jgi:hypothetical protein
VRPVRRPGAGNSRRDRGLLLGHLLGDVPVDRELDVNGRNRHPLYDLLTNQSDSSGRNGDVDWNFEKFLVSPRGEPVARFRPSMSPDAHEVIETLESILPGTAVPRWTTKPASEIEAGDRVRLQSGAELTATRVEETFLGREELICLIEDTPARWLAQPVTRKTAVEVLTAS